MKRLIGVLTMLVPAVLAETRPSGVTTVLYPDGTGVEIQTRSTGSNLPLSTSGTESVKPGSDFHRLVFTNDLPTESTVILGYDIEARKSGPGTYLVRIRPVDPTKLKVGGRGKWLPIPTIAGVREFPPLRMGDAVEVDILFHPVTKERIYDVLKVVSSRRPDSVPAKESGERFSLMSPRVVVNGTTIREPREVWMTGGAVGIDMPGRGRFYFSLTPPPNLPVQLAGWVDHSVLRFHAGSELVEIFAKRNVLERAEFATLWVYHEPDPGPRAAEMARLQQALAESRKKYTAGHPDVKALEEKLVRASGPVEFICGDDAESLTREKGPWD